MMDWLKADWPFWVSGLGIGLTVVGFAAASGRPLGVSRGFVNVCALASKHPSFGDPEGREGWRLWFLGGIPLGALLVSLLGDSFVWRTAVDATRGALLAPAASWQPVIFVLGGIAIGFGARKAGGCTSGHAITGMALGGRASVEATMGFMIAGVAVTHLVHLYLGGI